MANSAAAATLLKKFGTRLRSARVVEGYEEATDFAKDLGIEAATYRKYERGDALPPLDTLQMICKILGQSADFLLFGQRPDDRKR